MSKEVNLIKNTLIIFLGKLSTQIISFLLVPFYTYFLTPEQYGFVDLTIIYVSLLIPLLTLQLEMSVFRFLIDNRKNKKEKKAIITNVFITVIKIYFIFLILYLIINLFFNITYRITLVFYTLSLILSNLTLQVARGIGDNKKYAIASIITGFSTLLFNILFLYIFKLGIFGIFLATIISNTLCFIYLIFKLKIYKYLDKNYINKQKIKEYIKYSIPLIPNGIIWWVINTSDRTIISLLISTSATGIYAISNKFSIILLSIYNIFNMSWTESASLHINSKNKDEFFSKVFNNVLSISTSLSILLLAILPLIFNYIINIQYSDSYKYIPLLILGTIFNIIVMFLGAIYIAKKKTIEVTKTSLWSGILNLLINILLIKQIGIWAAALSTFLSFFIMTIYRYLDVKKYVKFKLNYNIVIIYIILFIITTINYYYKNNIINILYFIFITIILTMINLKIIKIFLTLIINKIKLNKK